MTTQYPTVHGNLALKAESVSTPRFTVINGFGAGRRTMCAQAPVAAPTHLPRALAAVVIAVIVFACLATAYAVLHTKQQAFNAAISSEQLEVVEVSGGDSLWSIAATYPIEGLDTSEVVDAIQAINGLDSGTLQPGMELQVPVS